MESCSCDSHGKVVGHVSVRFKMIAAFVLDGILLTYLVLVLSQFCLPLLLDKLSSELQIAKLESLKALVGCGQVHITSNVLMCMRVCLCLS